MTNCTNCPVQDGYKPAEALQQIGEPVEHPEALRLADALEKEYGSELLDDAANELRRQHARITELEAAESRLIALRATPPAPASDAWRTMIEGMSVSVDASTGEHDAGNRYFGKVTEVMDDPESKQGVTLLIQDAKPNFALATPQAQDVQDAAFEAVRKKFCKLPRYSFFLSDPVGIKRVQDTCGNWVEFEAVHTLFDPVAIDAAIAASAAKGA